MTKKGDVTAETRDAQSEVVESIRKDLSITELEDRLEMVPTVDCCTFNFRCSPPGNIF